MNGLRNTEDAMLVVNFCDEANLHMQLRGVGRRTDYAALRRFLADPDAGRVELHTFVYATLPHDDEAAAKVQRFHDALRAEGCLVKTKRAKQLPGGQIKANSDLLMALDAYEYVSRARPDVAVLASGDGDFAELALRLRALGVRVEAASLLESLAFELKCAVNGVINLQPWAAQCPALPGVQAPGLGTAAVIDEALA